MTQETLTAQKLYDEFEIYPEPLELLVGDEWREITHIANYQIVNGAWISDGEKIYIECGEHGEYEYQYRMMDELTIRYDGEKSVFVELTSYQRQMLFGLGHPDDEDFDDDENYPDDEDFDDDENYPDDEDFDDDDDTQPIAVMSDDYDLESQYEDRYISIWIMGMMMLLSRGSHK
jgi:hypothetical protein